MPFRGTHQSRRRMTRNLSALGLSMVSMPLVRPVLADECGDGHPMTLAWVGSEDPGYNASYVEKYGCTSNFSFFESHEDAFAKLRAGFAPDVITPCANWIRRFYDAELLAEIDVSRLRFYDDLIPGLTDVADAVIDGKRVWVPIDWGQVSVIFRTDMAPEYVDNPSWKIMWDPKYAGKLVMLDSVDESIAIAALYLGIDPYAMTEADVARVRDVLVEQRSLVRTYSSDPTGIQQMIVSGEVVAFVGFGYSVTPLVKEGLPVQFMQPKEGALTWVCGVSRGPASEQNGEEMVQKAYDVIDGFICPETGVYEITQWGYGHANAKSYGMVEAAVLDELNIPQDPAAHLGNAYFQKPLPDLEKLTSMWEEIKAGF